MKNNGCLFSDIQNLCNAVSDWLIQKINNPIETNETIACACCLTGSAVITHDVTTGTGYCLVGFNWIIDFLN